MNPESDIGRRGISLIGSLSQSISNFEGFLGMHLSETEFKGEPVDLKFCEEMRMRVLQELDDILRKMDSGEILTAPMTNQSSVTTLKEYITSMDFSTAEAVRSSFEQMKPLLDGESGLLGFYRSSPVKE